MCGVNAGGRVGPLLGPVFLKHTVAVVSANCLIVGHLCPYLKTFTRDVNGLHETKDCVSCGGVILCFEVMVVTREDFLLKFAALGQARKLA